MMHTEPTSGAGIFDGDFWVEAADRAVKSAGGALLAAWGGDWMNFYSLGWDTTWRMGVALVTISLVTSIVSAPLGRRGTASALPIRRR